MTEVLVWVMGHKDGSQVILGTVGGTGLIWRESHTDGEETWCGSRRGESQEYVDEELRNITETAAAQGCVMMMEPAVLRINGPKLGAGPILDSWVERVLLPVVEMRMAALTRMTVHWDRATGTRTVDAS